ncbi:MAG: ATP-binding protein [Pseudomonadota bacterium]
MSAALSARRMAANARVIDCELEWLEAVMAARFAAYGEAGGVDAEALPGPPVLDKAAGPYAELVKALALDADERLVLALALAPHVAPALLDPFLLQNQATGRRFTEFGGLVGQSHAGFLPTAETAMFLLAGDDRLLRIQLERLFARDHVLSRRGILLLDARNPEEPALAMALRLSSPGLHLVLRGDDHPPEPGPDFPATPVTTPLDWDDLVLDAATMKQVDMIGRWVEHSKTLMEDWGLGRRLKPGYRCLFHGTPGTGKTLTASLLGKRYGVPVYRVDISRVVSKWIGETEKNLATLFDQAADRNWILFFDEADALFGKRTESRSSNDRHANQQIAYLLQRLEDFPGLAILATNQHNYVDEAFARRFQSSIRFPMPDAAARLRLWQDSFESDGFALAEDVRLAELAEKYELAGGAIINVLRHAGLMAVARKPAVVHAHDLLDGIRRELQKDGHYVSK